MVEKLPQLPTSLPGLELLAHVSARRRNQIVDTVFELCGGVERLTDYAEKNYADFIEKVWVKGLPRNAATEHTVNADSVEALLDKLEASERALPIDGHCTVVEVSDAPETVTDEDGEAE